MADKVISVIIPLYNQLEYFKKCIDSICNQTYRNIEIICVDDGSTDGAEKYLDEVAAGDSRVIAIHQKNAGESHARNVGLEHATGEYITFVDCDDWIEPDMYETMMAMAVKDDLDLVACSWYKVVEDKSFEIINEEPVSSDIIGRDELLQYLYKRDLYRGFAYMWNKIYRRNILENDGKLIKFNEGLSLGGDVLYLAQAAIKAKKSKYIDKAFYHYLIREGSGSHSKDLNRMKDWIEAYNLTIKLLEVEGINEETINYVKRFKAYHAMEAVKLFYNSKNLEEIRFFVEIMKQNEGIYCELNKLNSERIKEYRELLKDYR